jgi:hypothetical protein
MWRDVDVAGAWCGVLSVVLSALLCSAIMILSFVVYFALL